MNYSSYGYIEKGRIIAPVAMRSRFKDIGAWHLLTDEQRAEYGWYPCVVENEAFDARTQTRSPFPRCYFDDTRKIIIASYTVLYKTDETIKQELSNLVSSKRYDVEVSGTIWNGLGIATDRESQTKLLVEKLAAENGSRLDGENWKCFDLTKDTAVFRQTTNLEMIDIANTAYNHVRDCFRREAELLSIIDSGTFTEDMLDQGWPVTWM